MASNRGAESRCEALQRRQGTDVRQSIRRRRAHAGEAALDVRIRECHTQLRERGEREEKALREILETQRKRVLEELRKHEGTDAVQLTLQFDDEEMRQLQADIRAWRTRLEQFDHDLTQEPQRVREFYEVRARRVEPVGLVYLWPETN